MDVPEKTAGSRRWKVLITAGVAAALTVGSLAIPSSANAATPTLPTVSLTAPAQIVNSDPAVFDPTQVYTLTVDNSATGTAALSGDVLAFALDLPSGLACAAVAFNGVGTAPAIALTAFKNDASNCAGSAVLPDLPAGSKVSYQYDVTIDGRLGSGSNSTLVTGTVPSTFELASSVLAPVVPAVTASSNLVNASAPTLATAPAATVHNAYSAQVLTSGFPRPSYTVFEQHVSSATPPVTTYQQICAASNTATCTLNDGLVFDPATGAITASAATLTNTDTTPPTYVIVANNKNGGAAANDDTAKPPVMKNDVSVTVSIPVLFSDVPLSNPFATDIYALAGAGVINGQTDGSFLPVATVNRQEFASFAAKVYNLAVTNPNKQIATGPCTSSTVDNFTDVAVTSTFCSEVNGLAKLGIINGFTDGTFRGTTNVSREEVAAFLYRLDKVLRSPATKKPIADAACPAGGSRFTDVPSTSLFCGDIEWAATNGITTGTTATTFQPNGPALREAAAAFIFRFAVLENS